jgi:hypothetical protein
VSSIAIISTGTSSYAFCLGEMRKLAELKKSKKHIINWYLINSVNEFNVDGFITIDKAENFNNGSKNHGAALNKIYDHIFNEDIIIIIDADFFIVMDCWDEVIVNELIIEKNDVIGCDTGFKRRRYPAKFFDWPCVYFFCMTKEFFLNNKIDFSPKPRLDTGCEIYKHLFNAKIVKMKNVVKGPERQYEHRGEVIFYKEHIFAIHNKKTYKRKIINSIGTSIENIKKTFFNILTQEFP